MAMLNILLCMCCHSNASFYLIYEIVIVLVILVYVRVSLTYMLA